MNSCAREAETRSGPVITIRDALAALAIAAGVWLGGCDAKQSPPSAPPAAQGPAEPPSQGSSDTEPATPQSPQIPPPEPRSQTSPHDLPPGWSVLEAIDTNALPPEPRREFRAAWVATVKNIDWPSKPGLSISDLRKEMNAILDRAESIGLNALIFQARPSCDAFYRSELEPWSEYLTGASGTPPTDPDYDPLREWIDGAHARGLELHAWINPFRARHFQAQSPNAATHIASVKPELVREYAKYQWLDPGEPEAQDHSMRVIMDLVTRYDLDGVHIDDYFYPYPDGKVQFPDDRSWDAWLAGERAAGRDPATTQSARDDWRRANINRFVQRMYTDVKQAKPWMRVGISPFGIWRPGNPPGVKGFDAYAGLFADAKLWAEQGWCDYLAPQIYWRIDAKEQSHEALLDWWLGVFPAGMERDLFVGNYTSRIPSDPNAKVGDRNSWEPEELLRQIELTRTRAGVATASERPRGRGAGGNIHFSMVALLDNRRQLASTLASGLYRDPAIPTEMTWSLPTLSSTSTPHSTTLRLREADGSWALSALPAHSSDSDPLPRLIVWSQSPEGLWTTHRPARTVTGVPLNAQAIAAASLDRFGRLGPRVLLRRPADSN